jgi:PAT family beta-lactamase induction signal transducer AmpG
MIVAGGGAFSLAHFYSWSVAYQFMALFMSVGVICVMIISEPDHLAAPAARETEQALLDRLGDGGGPDGPAARLRNWFIGAVVSPFADFFARHGLFAAVILLFIMVFRMSDITLGVMANPFYIDMGYSELEIGLVTKTVGPIVTIAGALVGGALVMRYSIMRMLMAGAVLVVLTNLLFAWLAMQQAELIWLIMVVGADNLAAGIATTTFVAYLSGLTNKAYTATQYALFSSIMLLLAKFVAGFSGLIVDATNYPVFFAYAAVLGLPSIFLIGLLERHEEKITVSQQEFG